MGRRANILVVSNVPQNYEDDNKSPLDSICESGILSVIVICVLFFFCLWDIKFHPVTDMRLN